MLSAALLRICYLAVMFVAGMAFSNIALPQNFGAITLLILNASILSIITGLGADSIVLHKVSSKRWAVGKAVKFTWYVIAIQITLFLILEVGSLKLSGKTILANEGGKFFPVEIFYFTGLLLTEKFLALLYASNQSVRANAILILVALSYCLLLLIFYYFISAGFQTVLYFFSFQSLFQGLLLTFLFHKKNKFTDKEKIQLSEFTSALKISFIIVITNVIQLLAYRIDFWLLKFFYTNYEVGLYAQANKFANLLWIIPNILAQLLIPKFGLLGDKKVSKIFSGGLYFNLIGLLATIICANFFYFFYLNSDYKAGLSAFYLMLPGYFFWAVVIYYGAYFSWAGKFVYNLICSSTCFILVIIADLFFIPKYGIKGAALANTIGYTIVFFMYMIIFSRKTRIRLSDLLLFRKHDLAMMVKFVKGE